MTCGLCGKTVEARDARPHEQVELHDGAKIPTRVFECVCGNWKRLQTLVSDLLETPAPGTAPG